MAHAPVPHPWSTAARSCSQRGLLVWTEHPSARSEQPPCNRSLLRHPDPDTMLQAERPTSTKRNEMGSQCRQEPHRCQRSRPGQQVRYLAAFDSLVAP